MTWVVAIVLVAYIGMVAAFNVPVMKRGISRAVSAELSAWLGTEVSIGDISPGFLNRLIVEDVLLHDRQGREMLRVARFSAKYSLMPLLKGRVAISTVQLFGFNLHAAKDGADTPPNFQFLIDKFSSGDNTQPSRIDLRINTLLLRRGTVTYDVCGADSTPGRFNTSRLAFSGIRGNLSLRSLRNDSLNLSVRHLSLAEQNSGFELSSLDMRLVAGQRGAVVDGLQIALPQTALAFDTIRVCYSDIADLTARPDSVRFDVRLLPSGITLNDIRAFVPEFSQFKDEVRVEMAARGTPDDIECTLLNIDGDHLRMQGRGEVSGLTGASGGKPFVKAELQQALADSTGVAFLTRNLGHDGGVPAAVRNMKFIDFSGYVEGPLDNIAANGLVRTDLGTVAADVHIDTSTAGGRLRGRMQTDNFELGRLTGNSDLDAITFSLDINAGNMTAQYPHMTVRGLVDSLQYRGYTYKDIELDGEYRDGGFDGRASLNDENARVGFNGSFNTAGATDVFRFRGVVDGLRPAELKLSDRYQGCEMSFRVNADFTGGNIDDMMGRLTLDSMVYITPERTYTLDSISLSAHRTDDGGKQLRLKSDFVDAGIEGNYSYRTLYSSVASVLGRYLPGYFPQTKARTADNDFSFDVTVSNTDFVAAVMQVPLTVYSESTLKGFFSDNAGRMRIEGYFPRLRYDGRLIESGVVQCDNSGDRFQANVRFSNRRADDALNVSASATARNDSIEATLNWGNTGAMTLSGRLDALIHFAQNVDAEGTEATRSTVIDVQPSDLILNDTLWNVHRSRITIEKGRTVFSNLTVNNADRHIQIDGVLGPEPEDSLLIDMNRMNIRYIFDIADLGVTFDGEATGRSVASGVTGEPYLLSDLFIGNFGYNDSIIGDMNIIGEWHNDRKGLYLDADIREGDVARTTVDGYIYPLKPTSSLDLNVHADSTNVGFLQSFLSNITSDFHGRVSGDVRLYGKFKALTVSGRVFGDAGMKIDMLNTTYSVRDSIVALPEGLFFSNAAIYDERGTRGVMNGQILWTHFRDVSYDLSFDVNNMLVMNTAQNADYTFYGTVFGTGSISLTGNDADGMNIDMGLTTNRNTTFTYIKDGVTTAAAGEFVRFVDRTPRRTVPVPVLYDVETTAQPTEKQGYNGSSGGDIRLNILAEITPDAVIRIVMDPLTGDAIISRGTANLRIDWYNKGSFTMFGSYRMSQGTYKMSIQEIIRKDFVIQDGSTLTFAGDPFEAGIDLHTKYQVNSVSLNDLIPNASSYITQTSVRVDCLMDMTGSITQPQLSLGLELPLENDEIQALINNYIPTEEQMNMQILYLLSIGKFYTPEYVSVTQNSNVMSSVVSSTLSGQLNNALSAVINSDDWNFGTNLSTGQDGWTDMEFEGILSGTLLNNRLIVNGNFGYRENRMSNTNFVGDFDAQLLLTPSGDIRLKAYNETNDKYFTRTNLTTQGIGIIFRKDFDSWNDFTLRSRLKHRRRTAPAADSTAVRRDTLLPVPVVQPADTLQPVARPEVQLKRERGND